MINGHVERPFSHRDYIVGRAIQFIPRQGFQMRKRVASDLKDLYEITGGSVIDDEEQTLELDESDEQRLREAEDELRE